jgi:CheY-like chemotaxis protein
VSLAKQLLSYSRQQAPEPVALDLGALVRSNESIVRALAGERVTVAIEDEAAHAVADRTHLEQVLFNLVANARDAMPDGGRLTIATGVVEPQLAEPGDRAPRAALIVADTGVGMDAETRSRAFDPFFTTKDVGRGTGLGLNTVYRIVREAGGTVEIASSPGAGTTVRVLLPLADAVAEPAAAARSTVTAHPPGGHETVLVVEDEEAVRELVVDMLETAGFTALGVSRPLVALEACRDYDGAIDLLLTDIVMPEMSGLELARQIRAARPGTRVLYMSGYADHSELPGGSLDERIRLVQKPFDSRTLVASVREALDADDTTGLVAVPAAQGT